MKNFIKKLLAIIPDKWFLRLRYKIYTGKRLNLKNPKRFNEKMG